MTGSGCGQPSNKSPWLSLAFYWCMHISRQLSLKLFYKLTSKHLTSFCISSVHEDVINVRERSYMLDRKCGQNDCFAHFRWYLNTCLRPRRAAVCIQFACAFRMSSRFLLHTLNVRSYLKQRPMGCPGKNRTSATMACSIRGDFLLGLCLFLCLIYVFLGFFYMFLFIFCNYTNKGKTEPKSKKLNCTLITTALYNIQTKQKRNWTWIP